MDNHACIGDSFGFPLDFTSPKPVDSKLMWLRLETSGYTQNWFCGGHQGALFFKKRCSWNQWLIHSLMFSLIKLFVSRSPLGKSYQMMFKHQQSACLPEPDVIQKQCFEVFQGFCERPPFNSSLRLFILFIFLVSYHWAMFCSILRLCWKTCLVFGYESFILDHNCPRWLAQSSISKGFGRWEEKTCRGV